MVHAIIEKRPIPATLSEQRSCQREKTTAITTTTTTTAITSTCISPKMFNNNADFEKHAIGSSSSSTETITPDNATATATTNNSNNSANNSTNNITNSTTITTNTIKTNINMSLGPEEDTTTAITTTEVGGRPSRTTTTTATATTTANDNRNNYFNRFDNRIAANLAAVINVSRFRSSSCGRSTTTATTTTTAAASTRSSRIKGVNASITLSPCGGARVPATLVAHTTSSTTRRPSSRTRNSLQHTLACDVDATDTDSGARPPTASLNQWSLRTSRRQRPTQLLLTQLNLNCNDNEKALQASSSDENNSPTELNNCKRLADKPPLVKRLTMGLPWACSEESRPLVNNFTPTTTHSLPLAFTAAVPAALETNHHDAVTTAATHYSNGYVNEAAYEPEKCIASKFGDSCRQSLTAIPMLDSLNLNDNNEFELKKRYLRETSSANSSPKIFAHRLRPNGTHPLGGIINAACTVADTKEQEQAEEEAELKDAPWFQAGISRDIAMEVLSTKSPGAFLVRKSTSKRGCYALTLRVPTPPEPKIAHYVILTTTRGYKIKGFRKEFSTLKALITHHSVMPELLPVPLAMPRPTNMTSSRRNLDDFDTYDSLQMLLKYLRAKNIEYE